MRIVLGIYFVVIGILADVVFGLGSTLSIAFATVFIIAAIEKNKHN